MLNTNSKAASVDVSVTSGRSSRISFQTPRKRAMDKLRSDAAAAVFSALKLVTSGNVLYEKLSTLSHFLDVAMLAGLVLGSGSTSYGGDFDGGLRGVIHAVTLNAEALGSDSEASTGPFTAALVLTCIAMWLVIAMAVSLTWSAFRNGGVVRSIWMLRPLRFLAGLLVTVLLIPSIRVLTSAMRCDGAGQWALFPEVACFGARHAAWALPALATLLFFAPLALFVAYMVFDFDPVSNKWIARADSRSEAAYVLFKIVAVLSTFLGEPVVTSTLVCVGLSCFLVTYVVLPPFFRRAPNIVRAATFGGVALLALYDLVAGASTTTASHTEQRPGLFAGALASIVAGMVIGAVTMARLHPSRIARAFTVDASRSGAEGNDLQAVAERHVAMCVPRPWPWSRWARRRRRTKDRTSAFAATGGGHGHGHGHGHEESSDYYTDYSDSDFDDTLSAVGGAHAANTTAAGSEPWRRATLDGVRAAVFERRVHVLIRASLSRGKSAAVSKKSSAALSLSLTADTAPQRKSHARAARRERRVLLCLAIFECAIARSPRSPTLRLALARVMSRLVLPRNPSAAPAIRRELDAAVALGLPIDSRTAEHTLRDELRDSALSTSTDGGGSEQLAVSHYAGAFARGAQSMGVLSAAQARRDRREAKRCGELARRWVARFWAVLARLTGADRTFLARVDAAGGLAALAAAFEAEDNLVAARDGGGGGGVGGMGADGSIGGRAASRRLRFMQRRARKARSAGAKPNPEHEARLDAAAQMCQKYADAAMEAYERLLANPQTTTPGLLRAYGSFVEDVFTDAAGAEQCYIMADELEERLVTAKTRTITAGNARRRADPAALRTLRSTSSIASATAGFLVGEAGNWDLAASNHSAQHRGSIDGGLGVGGGGGTHDGTSTGQSTARVGGSSHLLGGAGRATSMSLRRLLRFMWLLLLVMTVVAPFWFTTVSGGLASFRDAFNEIGASHARAVFAEKTIDDVRTLQLSATDMWPDLPLDPGTIDDFRERGARDAEALRDWSTALVESESSPNALQDLSAISSRLNLSMIEYRPGDPPRTVLTERLTIWSVASELAFRAAELFGNRTDADLAYPLPISADRDFRFVVDNGMRTIPGIMRAGDLLHHRLMLRRLERYERAVVIFLGVILAVFAIAMVSLFLSWRTVINEISALRLFLDLPHRIVHRLLISAGSAEAEHESDADMEMNIDEMDTGMSGKGFGAGGGGGETSDTDGNSSCSAGPMGMTTAGRAQRNRSRRGSTIRVIDNNANDDNDEKVKAVDTPDVEVDVDVDVDVDVTGQVNNGTAAAPKPRKAFEEEKIKRVAGPRWPSSPSSSGSHDLPDSLMMRSTPSVVKFSDTLSQQQDPTAPAVGTTSRGRDHDQTRSRSGSASQRTVELASASVPHAANLRGSNPAAPACRSETIDDLVGGDDEPHGSSAHTVERRFADSNTAVSKVLSNTGGWRTHLNERTVGGLVMLAMLIATAVVSLNNFNSDQTFTAELIGASQLQLVVVRSRLLAREVYMLGTPDPSNSTWPDPSEPRRYLTTMATSIDPLINDLLFGAEGVSSYGKFDALYSDADLTLRGIAKTKHSDMVYPLLQASRRAVDATNALLSVDTRGARLELLREVETTHASLYDDLDRLHTAIEAEGKSLIAKTRAKFDALFFVTFVLSGLIVVVVFIVRLGHDLRRRSARTTLMIRLIPEAMLNDPALERIAFFLKHSVAGNAGEAEKALSGDPDAAVGPGDAGADPATHAGQFGIDPEAMIGGNSLTGMFGTSGAAAIALRTHGATVSVSASSGRIIVADAAALALLAARGAGLDILRAEWGLDEADGHDPALSLLGVPIQAFLPYLSGEQHHHRQGTRPGAGAASAVSSTGLAPSDNNNSTCHMNPAHVESQSGGTNNSSTAYRPASEGVAHVASLHRRVADGVAEVAVRLQRSTLGEEHVYRIVPIEANEGAAAAVSAAAFESETCAMRAAFRAFGHPVLVFGADSRRILFANAAAERATCSAEAGIELRDLLIDDLFDDEIDLAVAGGGIGSGEPTAKTNAHTNASAIVVDAAVLAGRIHPDNKAPPQAINILGHDHPHQYEIRTTALMATEQDGEVLSLELVPRLRARGLAGVFLSPKPSVTTGTGSTSNHNHNHNASNCSNPNAAGNSTSNNNTNSNIAKMPPLGGLSGSLTSPLGTIGPVASSNLPTVVAGGPTAMHQSPPNYVRAWTQGHHTHGTATDPNRTGAAGLSPIMSASGASVTPNPGSPGRSPPHRRKVPLTPSALRRNDALDTGAQSPVDWGQSRSHTSLVEIEKFKGIPVLDGETGESAGTTAGQCRAIVDVHEVIVAASAALASTAGAPSAKSLVGAGFAAAIVDGTVERIHQAPMLERVLESPSSDGPGTAVVGIAGQRYTLSVSRTTWRGHPLIQYDVEKVV